MFFSLRSRLERSVNNIWALLIVGAKIKIYVYGFNKETKRKCLLKMLEKKLTIGFNPVKLADKICEDNLQFITRKHFKDYFNNRNTRQLKKDLDSDPKLSKLVPHYLDIIIITSDDSQPRRHFPFLLEFDYHNNLFHTHRMY